MTKRHFFLSWIPAVAILLCISCSKDQTALNRLKGEWKMTTFTEDGVTYTPEAGIESHVIFGKCKEGETCEATLRQTADNWASTSEYTTSYRVENDGKTLLLDGGSVTIVELTPKKLAVENPEEDIRITYEKQ